MISYKKLFHLMIDRGIKKGELSKLALLPPNTMQRLSKDKTVNTDTINRICLALKCQPGDIMECVPDDSDTPYWDRYRAMMKGIKEAETNADAVQVAKEAIKKEWEIETRKR